MTPNELRKHLRAGVKAFGTLIVSPSPRWPDVVRAHVAWTAQRARPVKTSLSEGNQLYGQKTMPFKRIGLQWFVLAVALFQVCTCTWGGSENKPNVLFICVDDLNDWVGCLGARSDIRTPHIDSLAQRGMLFTHAHCPAPLCNPCRTAIMTGLRPSTSGIYNNNAVWAQKMPDWVTLPRHFKNNGYTVAGAGKIYHHTPKGFNPKDQWHEYLDLVPDQGTQAEHVRHLGFQREYFSDMPDHPNGSWDWGPFQKGDDAMGDGHAVQRAQAFLGRKHEKPFFLAVGLFQPHLPFYAWCHQAGRAVRPARGSDGPVSDLDDTVWSAGPEQGRRG